MAHNGPFCVMVGDCGTNMAMPATKPRKPRPPLTAAKLDELAQKQIYEFAFVLQPLKIQGATGSTVAPIAVR